MSANFKVIFREEEGSPEGSPKYEPGCPLLIAAVQISRNTETGDSFLQARATNVSNNLAEEVRALARVSYPDGSVEEIPLGGFDADVKPGADHVFAAAKLSRSDAERADVRITLVKGTGEAWESKEDPVELPLAEELGFSSEVQKIRQVHIGRKGCRKPANATYKAADCESYWVCTCGQTNTSDCCIGCKLKKKDALTANDADFFEEEIRKAKADKEKEAQGRVKTLKITVVTVITIGLLLFAGVQIHRFATTATDGSGTGAFVVTRVENHSPSETLESMDAYDRGKHGSTLAQYHHAYSQKSTATLSASFTYSDYGTPATVKYNFESDDPNFTATVGDVSANQVSYTFKTTSTDEHGQPTSVSITSNHGDVGTIDFKWHSKGHLEKYTYKGHNGGTEIRHYNESGEMTSKQVDSTTYEYKYKYDKQGRIISKIATGSDGSKETTRYEYDKDDNIAKATYNDGSYETREYSYIDNVSPAIAASSNHFEGLDFLGTKW